MPTVNIRGHTVEVDIISFDKGEQPYKVGHPDNWTPGSSAYIEFKFATGDELFNELLTENCYEEAEDQLLAKMEETNE